jgi:hypothetical protein
MALTLLLATSALLLSWRALDRANDARDIALAGRAPGGSSPAIAPTATGSDQPAATPEPTATISTATGIADPSSTGAPPLDRRTVYKAKYEKQMLTLKPQGSYPMYADLDEPRANVADDHEIALFSATTSTPAHFKLGDEVAASEGGSPGMSPQDCGERIRTAPIGRANIPVRQGAVVCLTTSYAQARSRGDYQRLVLFEVTAVANDSAVTVQITAWDIPR